jgi:hypothetical protein
LTCRRDPPTWRFSRPKRELNFPDVESRKEAELLASVLWVASREEEREHGLALQYLAAHEAGDLAMVMNRKARRRCERSMSS